MLGSAASRLLKVSRKVPGIALSFVRRCWKALRYGPLKTARRLRRSWREACQRQLHFYMAALRRWVAWRTTFIGVTGSCGKTTVTNLVGVILSHKGKCSVCVDCNYDVDVATTVLALPNCTNFCIQEVATIRPGMIASSSSILKPSIAIVTTIGSDHYVKFRSLEATSQEKGVLVERLPSWGTAILNADDPNVIDMARRTPARVLTFGLSPNADVRAIDVSSAWPDRLALTVVYNGKAVRVPTRFVGAHSTTSVLAAIACGIACGVDLATCVEAIARAHPVFGRYSVHERSDGAAYVLDTHKAPFWTIASSYAFIGSARATRKTMVFGTISDYPGERSRRYRRIAREALQVADRVVFVGPSAGHTSRLRQEEIRHRLFNFETVYQASRFLADDPLAGELIYLKASISEHLERMMLSEVHQVVCWLEKCGRPMPCPKCKDYRNPTPPPLGVSHAPAPLLPARRTLEDVNLPLGLVPVRSLVG